MIALATITSSIIIQMLIVYLSDYFLFTVSLLSVRSRAPACPGRQCSTCYKFKFRLQPSLSGRVFVLNTFTNITIRSDNFRACGEIRAGAEKELPNRFNIRIFAQSFSPMKVSITGKALSLSHISMRGGYHNDLISNNLYKVSFGCRAEGDFFRRPWTTIKIFQI
jgi:hypothetical protein